MDDAPSVSRLVGLTFENYKPFRAREHVDVRPITVFIGRNSSGKSSIARLPILVGRSLTARPLAPLVFFGDDVDFGASFREVVHNHNERLPINLGIEWDTIAGQRNALDVGVLFWTDDGLKTQVVTNFQFTVGGETVASLHWDEQGDPRSGLTYFDTVSQRASVRARFKGFYPFDAASWSLSSEEALRYQRVSLELIALGGMLASAVYLGPFRKVPERYHRVPEADIHEIGVHGALAPHVLASDAMRGGRSIVDAVGSWYRDHLGGFTLDVANVDQGASLVLRHPTERGLDVNLLDTGVGLHQVLPVIVQRHLAASGHATPLEIIEQPELHLHPGAHGDLADLYVASVKQGTTRFLIETHSDNFVLRLRRRIAEGAIAASDVALYWVDDDLGAPNKVRRINIDARGEVDSWPHGVFSEGIGEVRSIRAAQRGKTP